MARRVLDSSFAPFQQTAKRNSIADEYRRARANREETKGLSIFVSIPVGEASTCAKESSARKAERKEGWGWKKKQGIVEQ